MAFLAVVREGLETALFFYAAVAGRRAATAQPLIGFIVGIAIAIVLGLLIYRGAVRINLSKFFTWTGMLLILVAAGILEYGVHDFQEAGVLPGLNTLAFDVSGTLAPDSWYGALLDGMFNYHAADRPCWRPSPGSPTSCRRADPLPPAGRSASRAGTRHRRPVDRAPVPRRPTRSTMRIVPRPSRRRPGRRWPAALAGCGDRRRRRRRRGRRPDRGRGHRHRVRGRAHRGGRRHRHVHDHQQGHQGHRVLRLRRGRPGHGRGREHRARPDPRPARRAAAPARTRPPASRA